jgi:uncharacterized protein (UPF0332 family)
MVKPLLEKSKQSMLAAELLVKQQYYAGTVNRAYYSCLQFILHILLEKLAQTRETLEDQPRTGTHSKAQYLLESTLVLRDKSKKDYKSFQEKFPAFKQERVLADYHEAAFTQERAYQAISMAQSIMNTLNKHY